MRDPDRIEPTIALIKLLWESYPDMRLGQLIENLARDNTVWGVEDAEIMVNAALVLGYSWDHMIGKTSASLNTEDAS